MREAGLQVEDLVGVEGLPLSAAETTARRTDPTDWQVLLEAARAIERVPELLGLSPHLLCTARRPAQLIYGQLSVRHRTRNHPQSTRWSAPSLVRRRPRSVPSGPTASFAVSRCT